MPEKTDPLAGIETTAQRMLEALDKASSELSKTVDACGEQLSQYNLRLQKSLGDKLEQVKEQFISASESNLSEIETRKDHLIEELEEFERTQIDTIVTTARSVRESLNTHAQQVEQKISRLVEDQLAAMRSTLAAPEQEIPGVAQKQTGKFHEISATGKERVDETEIKNEEALAAKARQFESDLQELISKWKENLYAEVERHQSEFKSKVDDTLAQLTSLAEQHISDLQEKYETGAQAVSKAVSSNRTQAELTTRQWKEEASEVHDSFTAFLNRQKQDFRQLNGSRLEYKANEAKGEIESIAKEAREKVQASHKVLQNSLSRLEQDYRRKLDAVLSRLESTISETSRRAGLTSSIQQRAADELKEKLRVNLNDQGSEILRMVRKLSEQLESEYVRASRSLDDRVDTIKSSAVESLEKQVHAMKLELDKITRGFQHELRDLAAQADELEEAGKAAAVFVMAYRSSLLSLDSD
jgi:hypothetical protein